MYWLLELFGIRLWLQFPSLLQVGVGCLVTGARDSLSSAGRSAVAVALGLALAEIWMKGFVAIVGRMDGSVETEASRNKVADMIRRVGAYEGARQQHMRAHKD